MYTTDKKDFLNKFANFTAGQRSILPRDRVSEWFDVVEKKHEKIRGFLGGVRKILPIELEAEKVPSVSIDKVRPFYLQLSEVIPSYFGLYCISEEAFRYTSLNSGNRNFKWGKHISTWMSRNKIEESKAAKVKDILCKVGEVWATAKIKTTTLYFNITTDPWAFSIIGRYNYDRESCFTNGGCNEGHKYIIGTHENSYIVLISETDQPEKVDSPSIVTRMWGIPNEDFSRFHICNIYPKTPKDNGTIQECINRGFAQLLNVNKPVIESKFVARGIYYNPESGKIFARSPVEEKSVSIFLDAGDFWNLRKCGRCNHYPAEDGGIVDELSVCKTCRNGAWTCAWTKNLTFSRKNTAFDSQGKLILISNTPISNGEFTLVGDADGVYCLKGDTVVTQEGHTFSKFYKRLFTCNSCGKMTTSSSLICNKCSCKKEKAYVDTAGMFTVGKTW